MTDLPKSKAQALYDFALDELRLSSPWELSRRREICAAHKEPKIGAQLEAENGIKGSHPDAATYCTNVIAEAIKRSDQDRFYKTLVLVQLDKGRAYLPKNERGNFPTDFDAVIGTKDQALIDSIAKAAEDGNDRFEGADGRRFMLNGPLALDAGATKTSKEGGKVDDPLPKAMVNQIVAACYDPERTSYAFSEGGPSYPMSVVCYIAGQHVGADAVAAAQRAAATPPAKPATKPSRAAAGR